MLTILHTNDLHNHLRPEQAARLGEMRRRLGGAGLLVDAGDAISSGNVTYKLGGEPILDLMTEAGYDAMAVGNREFHFSDHGFRTKVERAHFPVLCANVRSKTGNAEPPVKPWVTRTTNIGKLCLFGLTVPMITERMPVRQVSSWVFDDPLEVAAGLVPQLRPRCDLLVCLSHIGLANDRRLAERVPGIDLVVGGHTHAVLEHGERVDDTLIVQAGWFGHQYGVVIVAPGPGGFELQARLEAL